MVLLKPIRPSRMNTQKRCPFHYREVECKSKKSRDTWTNRQIWPRSKKQSTSKANRVLPRECTGHNKHPVPTREDSTHGQNQMVNTKNQIESLQPEMEKLYTVSKNKTGSWLCWDHELLIAKFRLKLKKVGKTIRPFTYDLSQIPFNYTVQVANIFKGLDIIQCLKNYGWRFMTLHRRQW